MKVKVRTGNSLKVETVRGECGTTINLSHEEHQTPQGNHHQSIDNSVLMYRSSLSATFRSSFYIFS